MSAFIHGFTKTANATSKGAEFLAKAKNALSKTPEAVGSYLKGVRASGDVALKEHLNPMTAVKHYQDAWHGKTLADKMTSAGKALPSTIATGGYLYGAKKLLGKSKSDQETVQYAPTNYYY